MSTGWHCAQHVAVACHSSGRLLSSNVIVAALAFRDRRAHSALGTDAVTLTPPLLSVQVLLSHETTTSALCARAHKSTSQSAARKRIPAAKTTRDAAL
jgi:hypothetical protein